MIDPNHPTVRAMAEEMAGESCGHISRILGGEVPPIEPDAVRILAAMLVDPSLPATRDRWVRWGIANTVRRDWHALRDDPAALESAVSAALVTLST